MILVWFCTLVFPSCYKEAGSFCLASHVLALPIPTILAWWGIWVVLFTRMWDLRNQCLFFLTFLSPQQIVDHSPSSVKEFRSCHSLNSTLTALPYSLCYGTVPATLLCRWSDFLTTLSTLQVHPWQHQLLGCQGQTKGNESCSIHYITGRCCSPIQRYLGFHQWSWLNFLCLTKQFWE